MRHDLTDDEAAAALACILCRRPQIAAVAILIPTRDDLRVAMLRLGALPTRDSRALLYGVCPKHARNLQRTAARVEALIVETAARVVIH